MAGKKKKLQFRYYEMGPNKQVLALLGEDWRRPYGNDLDVLHFHNYMEVGICYEGEGESVLREYVTPFEGGCIVIVPPNYPHNNVSKDGSVAFWEWMYFDIESVLQEMKEMSCNKLDVEYMQNALYDSALFFHQEEYQKISQIILEIRRECDKKAYMYQEKLRSLLQGFVVELLRIHNVNVEMSRKNPRSFQIAPALTYVKKHCSEEIRIRDLADVCNISESHFRRIFQECMNMTPNDYVNVARIHKASKLLLKSHATMEEIAYRVGYSNVSTFNRNFKKMIGMTPYQWKRSPDNYAGQMLDFKISALKGW
ncbi:MAG: AraC family transcriptional regulator [Eubacteriales bacterium]|nr:AraC family transcriptional regulator [Eubacteriales bacterium]